jgi:hypothetical protein
VTPRSLEALDRVLEQGGEPDDILRSVVRVLTEDPAIEWAGIAFLEEGDVNLGPSAGRADESRRTRVPIMYGSTQVGELWIDGEADRGLIERIAVLVSPYVLIGWDTRGEPWEP